MNPHIKTALQLTWMVVWAYWLISGFRVKKAKSRESLFKRFIQYWLPLLVAFWLLGKGEWFGHTWFRENFVPHNNAVGITGLVLCLAGAAIACHSRYLLGKNWSVSVQQKEGHELIRSGMYSVVRHPIYTGLLLLFIGNTLIVGDYRGILAVLIVFVSFWMKLKKDFLPRILDAVKRTPF